jgi:hypothetical protein
MDAIAGLNSRDLVKKDATKDIAIQGGSEANLAMLEAQQLVEPNVVQAGHEGDTVGDRFDTAYLFGDRCKRRRFDAVLCKFQPLIKSC